LLVLLVGLLHPLAIGLVGAGRVIRQQVDHLIDDVQVEVVMHETLAGGVGSIDFGPKSHIGDDHIRDGERIGIGSEGGEA